MFLRCLRLVEAPHLGDPGEAHPAFLVRHAKPPLTRGERRRLHARRQAASLSSSSSVEAIGSRCVAAGSLLSVVSLGPNSEFCNPGFTCKIKEINYCGGGRSGKHFSQAKRQYPPRGFLGCARGSSSRNLERPRELLRCFRTRSCAELDADRFAWIVDRRGWSRARSRASHSALESFARAPRPNYSLRGRHARFRALSRPMRVPVSIAIIEKVAWSVATRARTPVTKS